MADRMGIEARGRPHTLPYSQRSTCIYQSILFSAASQLAWVGHVNLFCGSVWEVMGVHSAGELIPVEGGEDSNFNGTFFKGVVKTTWGSR